MERLNIVLAADSGFCRQLAVVVSGISRSALHVPHTIYVLHDGYDNELIGRVAKSAGENIELEWIDARSRSFDAAILPIHLPSSTLYRLRMEELLPTEVERLIYLDTDVVVREPLTELWEHDLGDALIGAVRDVVVPWAAGPISINDWEGLGLAPDMPCFNAGVLLIPLKLWRSRGVSAQAMDLLCNHSFRHADQCALNVVSKGDWVRLEPRWNLQSGHMTTEGSLAWITEPIEALEEARERPAVIHFNHNPPGWRRPWQPHSTYPNRELWLEDLDRTDWAGWRPDESRPSVLRRAARRLKRASRVLIHGA